MFHIPKHHRLKKKWYNGTTGTTGTHLTERHRPSWRTPNSRSPGQSRPVHRSRAACWGSRNPIPECAPNFFKKRTRESDSRMGAWQPLKKEKINLYAHVCPQHRGTIRRTVFSSPHYQSGQKQWSSCLDVPLNWKRKSKKPNNKKQTVKFGPKKFPLITRKNNFDFQTVKNTRRDCAIPKAKTP